LTKGFTSFHLKRRFFIRLKELEAVRPGPGERLECNFYIKLRDLKGGV